MKDKKTLVSIIVLLVLFLPMGIYGTVYHFQNKSVLIDDNPNQEFIYKNKVYYYQGGNLVSTYKCESECSPVASEIKDNTYGIHYYKRGTNEPLQILNDGYAVFTDGTQGVLYNFVLESVILNFEAVKTYNVEHTSPIMIISAAGKMGVVSLETMTPVVPIDYDFIGIPNRATNGVLDTSRFIAKNGMYWYVLESDGTYNHEPFRETIVDFNNNYVIVENMGLYKIYDYTIERNEYLKDAGLKGAYCVGDYVIVILPNNTLSVYKNFDEVPIETKVLEEYNDINFEFLGNKIDIYLDNNLKESVVLD